MVYKGSKYIQYLSIGKYLRGATTVGGGSSTTSQASQNKAALMARTRNAIASSSVSAQAASLTNQAGGNIGFTYE